MQAQVIFRPAIVLMIIAAASCSKSRVQKDSAAATTSLDGASWGSDAGRAALGDVDVSDGEEDGTADGPGEDVSPANDSDLASNGVAWKIATGFRVTSPIAVRGGLTCFTTAKDEPSSPNGLALPYYLQCFTGKGVPKWKVATQDGFPRTPVLLANGAVVLAENVLVAVTPTELVFQGLVGRYSASGKLEWLYQPNDATVTTSPDAIDSQCPAVDESGNVYVVAGDRLQAISPAGKLRWKSEKLTKDLTAGPTQAQRSPTLGSQGVYTASPDNLMYLFSTEGVVKNKVDVPAGFERCGAIVGASGIVVVGGGGAGIAAYDANLSMLWKFAPAGYMGPKTTCPVVGKDDTVYVVNGPVTAIRKGVVAWKAQFSDVGDTAVFPPVLLEDGRLILAVANSVYDGLVVVSATGEVVLKQKLPIPYLPGSVPWTIGGDGNLLYADYMNVIALDGNWGQPAAGTWSMLNGNTANSRAVTW